MSKKRLDSSFAKSLRRIRIEEGGNDDDPHDPGGRTSRGIIQREWDAFRKTHPGRPADVWDASDADINLIYRQQYWEPFCGKFPPGVDLCFFNASVNSGRFQATKELQRALGVTVDGWIGSITMAALQARNDRAALIADLSDRRRSFYRSLRLCPRYCRGWLARTERVEQDALMLAQGRRGRRPAALQEQEPELRGKAKAYPPPLPAVL